MYDAVPTEPDSRHPLSIAAIVDRDWLYGWECEIIQQILRIEGIAPPSVMRVPQVGGADAGLWPWRLATAVDEGLSRVLFHRNYRRVGRDHDARTILSALKATAIVEIPKEPGACCAAQPDYVLDLTEGRPEAYPGIQPRLGTFRFEWGDTNPILGKPDGAAEVLAKKPYSPCRLFFDPADGTAPRILTQLHRTFLCSWSENVRRLHWSGAMLFLDTIRDLAARGRQSRIWKAQPVSEHRRTTSPASPSGAILASGLALSATAGRMMERVVQRYTTKDEWCIYLKRNSVATDAIKNYAEWEELKPPEDRAWADPFVIERDGRIFIFVEEIDYKSNKGAITCLEHTPSGVQRLGVVINEPHHLSYPFLFEHEGDLFMLPESSAGREVVLWKCIGFPMRWERHRVLFQDISMVDATIAKNDDLWWLFATIDRIGGGDLTSELHAFYSEDPVAGTWTSHALNPLLVDPRYARMAGKIARMDGALIRFSQGSGFEYGEFLHMRRITDLSPSSYAEEPHATFFPAPGHISLHHFSTWNDVAVVDCCRRLRREGLRGAASFILPNTISHRLDNGIPGMPENEHNVDLDRRNGSQGDRNA